MSINATKEAAIQTTGEGIDRTTVTAFRISENPEECSRTDYVTFFKDVDLYENLPGPSKSDAVKIGFERFKAKEKKDAEFEKQKEKIMSGCMSRRRI